MENERKNNNKKFLIKINPMLPERFWSSSSTEKVNILLSLKETKKFITSLEIGELHYLIKSIGEEDFTELIPYMNKEQCQGIMDIELWVRDELKPERFAHWIDIIETLRFDDAKKFISSLDKEVIMSFIISQFEIYLLREYDEKKIDESCIITPDNTFVLKPREGGTPLIHYVQKIIELLYSFDNIEAFEFLLLAMNETPSNIEEFEFRFREGRLMDWGFPSFDEKYDIFTPVNLKKLKEILSKLHKIEREEEKIETGHFLINIPEGLFLYEVISLFNEKDLNKFLSNFNLLVNKVKRGLTEDLSDIEYTKSAMELSSSIISLALEYLSGKDFELARLILKTLWLKQLFQAGYTLIHRLKEKAKKIYKNAGIQDGFSLLPYNEEKTVDGLFKYPPKFYSGLKDITKDSFENFSSLTDLKLSARAIEKSEEILSYFENGFGFKIELFKDGKILPLPEDELIFIRFSTLLNNILANQIINDKPLLKPLSVEELKVFIKVVFHKGKLHKSIYDGAEKEAERMATARKKIPLLKEFFFESLAFLEECLCGIDTSKEIEGGFLKEVIIVK